MKDQISQMIFSNFLSEKLQNYGIKCWLKCNYNWLKKKSSQKTTSPFWKGIFSCVNCKKRFFATIHKELEDSKQNKDVIIFVNFEDISKHDDKIKPRIRCKGDKRLELAKELMYESTSNVISKNILGNYKKPINGN